MSALLQFPSGAPVARQQAPTSVLIEVEVPEGDVSWLQANEWYRPHWLKDTVYDFARSPFIWIDWHMPHVPKFDYDLEGMLRQFADKVRVFSSRDWLPMKRLEITFHPDEWTRLEGLFPRLGVTPEQFIRAAFAIRTRDHITG